VRGFFERRGREGFAKGAKEDGEKNTKKENVKSGKTLIQIGNAEKKILVFFSPLLRPLRNFCVLCVRKFSPPHLRAASNL
jgi:hypothetical protein